MWHGLVLGTHKQRMAELLLLALILAVGACGSDRPTEPTSDVQNTLVFTRSDGSRVEFSNQAQLFVWCGPWEHGGLIPTPSLHVWFGVPGASGAGWYLSAVVADVTVGIPVSFPNSFIWDEPKNVNLFVLDPPNEVSTQIDDAGLGGQITFQLLQCGAGGEVQFSVNAVIGSEFSNGPSITVTGSLRAPVGQPPSW